MTPIITVHSFRRGAGKSNLVANLAGLLLAEGQRVGIIDADFLAPSQHLFFNLPDSTVGYKLNDYLWGNCAVDQVVYDVTGHLDLTTGGKAYLVPASSDVSDVLRVARNSYDFERFSDGVSILSETLDLNYWLVDTSAGLSEQTLPSIAVSNTLVILLRPDPQDFQGTAVTVEVAHNLQVPRVCLVMNDMPLSLDVAQAKLQLEQTYHCDVVSMLPHSEAMLSLASSQIYALRYPNHALVSALKPLVRYLTA